MTTKEYLPDFQETIAKAEAYLQEEFKNIKTGRATPSLVEDIQIESYGVMMPLIQLASITAPEPNLLIVKPWDKTNLKSINQTLQNSDLGATASINDDSIMLKFASITEERRLELVKKIKEKSEAGKIKIRVARDKARELTNKAQADKEISEDEKYTRLEEIDKETKEANEKVKEISDKKEKEIMSI